METTATLAKKNLGIVINVAEEILNEYFAEPSHIEDDTFRCWMENALQLRIRQPIWTQPVRKVGFKYPKTVWEHFKKRFAPLWMKRRWPVKYATFTVNIFAAYPGLAFPLVWKKLFRRKPIWWRWLYEHNYDNRLITWFISLFVRDIRDWRRAERQTYLLQDEHERELANKWLTQYANAE